MKPVLMLCVVLGVSAVLSAEDLESRRGNFRIKSLVTTEGIKGEPEASRWSARILTRSGVLLHTIEKLVPYGSPFPGVLVSDNAGEAVVVDAFAGVVEFLDARGNTVNIWRPFGDAAPDHERILKCSVAGDRMVFLVSGPSFDRARVVMYSVAGEELWTGVLAFESGSEIYLSGDGATVIVSSYASGSGLPTVATEILDVRGASVRVLPLLMRNAAVDARSGRFVVADRNEVMFGPLDPSGECSQWTSPPGGSVITGVTCAGTSAGFVMERILAGAEGIRYADPTLHVVTEGGREIVRESFAGSNDTPAHISSRDGTILFRNSGHQREIHVSDYE